MTRQNCVILVAAVVCLGAGAVQAQYYYDRPVGVGPYVRAGVGPAFFPDGTLKQYGGPAGNSVNFDTGLAADMALGYAFSPKFSADLETGYIGTKINSASGFLSDNSRLYDVPFLGNVILSWPIRRTFIVPYVGAGIGFAAAMFDTDAFGPGFNDYVTGRESDVVPAGQVFAGLRFRVAPNAFLGVGYKFFATGAPTFTYPPDNFNVGFKGQRTSAVMFMFDARF